MRRYKRSRERVGINVARPARVGARYRRQHGGRLPLRSGRGGQSGRRARRNKGSDDLEKRVGRKAVGNLNLIPHNFLLPVRVFLAAAITTHTDFIWQHGERRKGVGLAEQDFMLVPGIPFVVKSAILANNNPEIISCILHWPSPPSSPRLGSKFFEHIMAVWYQRL